MFVRILLLPALALYVLMPFAHALSSSEAVEAEAFHSVLRRLPEVDQPEEELPRPKDGEDQPEIAREEASAEADEATAEQQADPDEADAEPGSLWKASFEVGLGGTDGNSQTFNMRFGTKMARKSDTSKFTFELTHLNKSDNGDKTARNFLFDSRIEWPYMESPWTYFIHGSGEYDEFKPFDIRLNADSGMGYQFAKNDISTLIGRLGGSVSREIDSEENEFIPELSMSMEWEHKFTERQKWNATVEYFPNLTGFGDYRLKTKTAWEIVVDPDLGMSLKFSMSERFDSTPGDSKRADLDYAALLLWSF